MPNWCNNTLIITGPEDKIQEFKERANAYGPDYAEPEWKNSLPKQTKEKNLLSFHAFVPVPRDIQARTYGGEHESRSVDSWNDQTDEHWLENEKLPCGYEWEIENWGCKWGACNVRLYNRELGEPLEYAFETPWGPPEEFLDKVSEMYPELKFHLNFSEEGMYFEGRLVYTKGDSLEKTYKKMEATLEEEE